MRRVIEIVRNYCLLNVQKLADERKMNSENCEIGFCQRRNSLPKWYQKYLLQAENK
jgi:hypothetical protein